MSGDKRALLKEWLKSGKVRLQPLTFPQRELWESSPVPVGDMANHICCIITINGNVAADDCEAAIQRVIERQEVLRLSFLPGKDAPLQMIRDSARCNFRYQELPPDQRHPEAIEKIAREIFSVPFDLVQGPLYRVECLRSGKDELALVFAIHHAIADGWTLGVFVQELCIAYIQRAKGIQDALPPVTMSYPEWGAAERSYWQPQELERCATYWRTNLAGTKRIWPSSEGPATAAGAPFRLVTHFPDDLANTARELARTTGATFFSTLLTAFQYALWQWTGVDDIVVGTPVANRGKQAVRETMGYCAGIVPLRGRVDPSRSFADSIRAVHANTVDSFAHAMPFVELARLMDDAARPGHNPLFEVRFALQNHPVPDVSLPGLSAKLRMRSTGTARFIIACEITELEKEGLEVVWLFRPELFSQANIEKLGDNFRRLLTEICRSPKSTIATIQN